MYYYLPDPPLFLVFFGLFMGITSGLAFEATLKQNLQQWVKTKDNQTQLLGVELQLPFFGICVGVCVFLAAGLEIFLLNPWISYAIALPLTIFIAGLVWKQLGILLRQLQQGGSKALDLDAYE